MPEYLGIYKGLVADNSDTENRGRVVVQIPAILGDTKSNWCEPIYPTVYRPKIGDVVWVQFANGDIAQPVYFSSDAVTAEKVVAGSLDAVSISATFAETLQLKADQIISGTFKANLGIAAMFQTVDGRVQVGDQGILLNDPSGIPFIDFPTDPQKTASFKGDAEIGGLTVTNGAAFRGVSEISGNSSMILRSTSTHPYSPPTAVVDWDSSTIDTSASPSGDQFGLFWNGSAFHTIDQYGRIYSNAYPGGSPAFVVTLERISTYHELVLQGIAQIGAFWYVMVSSPLSVGGTYQLRKYDATGHIVSSASYTPLSKPCVGTDGTNVLVADYDATNHRFRIQTFNASTLALSSTANTSTNPGFSDNPVAIMRGSFDFGATRTIIVVADGAHFWPFDSTLTYQPTDAFATPSGGGLHGATWDGTRFYSLRMNPADGVTPATGIVYKHTTYKSGTSDPHTINLTATWRDNDAGGTGTHETDMGAIRSFSMKKRARVTLTSPTIPDLGDPDDPNAVSFYLSNTTTARTSFFRQTLPADGVRTLTIGDAITYAGTNPPAANNFPTKPPGTITNDAGTLLISGDGTVQGSVFKQAGSTLSADLSDTGWVNLTINSGFAWRTGFEGKIRRIGNVVFMRGHVDRTVGTWTTGTINPVTIPVGYRPISQHDFSYGISTSANPAVITVVQAYVSAAGAVNSYSAIAHTNPSGSNNMSLSNCWLTT